MCRACNPESYEFDRDSYDPYAEFDREVGLVESAFEGGWSGEGPRRRRGTVTIGGGNPEFKKVLDAISNGNRDRNKLTDMIFFDRHPSRRGTRLGSGETALRAEWNKISKLVDAALQIDALRKMINDMGKTSQRVGTP